MSAPDTSKEKEGIAARAQVKTSAPYTGWQRNGLWSKYPKQECRVRNRDISSLHTKYTGCQRKELWSKYPKQGCRVRNTV
jgi:hypothetical protein